MRTYSEWLREQAPDQQEKSLVHMVVARELGEAQRAGRWDEAARLSAQVAEYYRPK